MAGFLVPIKRAFIGSTILEKSRGIEKRQNKNVNKIWELL